VFGNNSYINLIASRKQLLIAESELNRAQLVHEGLIMVREVQSLTIQARTLTSLASAVATLIVGLASSQHESKERVAEKASWWQTALKTTGIIRTCWTAFRSASREENK
jgi:hypothetical protein